MTAFLTTLALLLGWGPPPPPHLVLLVMARDGTAQRLDIPPAYAQISCQRVAQDSVAQPTHADGPRKLVFAERGGAITCTGDVIDPEHFRVIYNLPADSQIEFTVEGLEAVGAGAG